MGLFDRIFGKREKPFIEHGKGHDHCDFGMKSFNKSKRSKEFVDELNTMKTSKGRGKPVKPSTSTTTTTTTQPGGGSDGTPVIYLEFEGATVTGTGWNVYASTIVADPSGLGEYEKEAILQNTIYDYSSFDVIVTRDRTLYDLAPYNRRVRCIITESWEWYCGSSPCAGGVAFVGSFTSGNNTPCWVFSSALGYSIKNIQEAVSHEVGHTLGLRHQASWDENCVMTSAYNYGCCGEAPIMGVGYYQPDVHWWIGPTSAGCYSEQDDVKVISLTLQPK